MARAIIRWSVSHEGNNQTGNAVAARLREAGFVRVGTAAYEGTHANRQVLIDGLRDALSILDETPGGGDLDNVWTYVDDPDRN